MEVLNDEYYMKLALQAAAGASGQTSINPVVGCVVVNDGRIVGIGAHLKRGEGHAEVHALNMAGGYARGATAYVTLEPCSHHGRTPPCCERLIQEGVKRVVVAATDPNPLVAGRGIKRLQEAGVEVTVGLLEEQSRKLNETFNKYIMTKLPFVTIKTAVTLDGRVATRTGHSRWITGPEAREAVHTLRHRNQAIMVGVGTILADDSELTTRLTVPGIHPIRLVVDSTLRTPLNARVLNGEAPTILLATESAPEDRIRAMEERGAEVIVCGPGPRVDLALALRQLGEREISSILVEGGGSLNGSLLEAGLVDKIMLFYAPKLVGSEAPSAFAFHGPEAMGDALELDNVTVEQVGGDWCVTGYPGNRAKPE
ncbi:bifunctional diaminohydroxyphosphoribosylaminopyrimidine deaminase/5-amino-6-(5-phosphoribosylamino)uracil reductase RibD [Cohnella sp. AR92]|uniref:bifunctional diaminohydroxyphosphoribosylaminopyrimidine deaminase/5-amino-6-(5-phosphoribosylamino)uracil reductase RibD n=1 Tax=Cohnella sp. AR92 TaxID=648716 RepID=UPI000F8DE433|nr:bifunctional diaminohydroxyphosphoribosylaminopyrimidine deaminase/5-amino-6-(5-phosphoribosylamino)uracil reductase RibD [Cohnella sp. AR92]RUS48122.1 bifunctional diaminohydroxyphosphoribosylaminopyrimidine deaminase/5-amino-6-(5-phosphoribosylamino)uracil reductase RibD [Cohnella sp. AR92]